MTTIHPATPADAAAIAAIYAPVCRDTAISFELVERLGYCGVVAGITLPNPASVGIHEHFGFKAVGRIPAAGSKLGAWHDVGYWHKQLPEEPTDVRTFLDQPT